MCNAGLVIFSQHPLITSLLISFSLSLLPPSVSTLFFIQNPLNLFIEIFLSFLCLFLSFSHTLFHSLSLIFSFFISPYFFLYFPPLTAYLWIKQSIAILDFKVKENISLLVVRAAKERLLLKEQWKKKQRIDTKMKQERPKVINFWEKIELIPILLSQY